ncbi:hypothetical protein [Aquimarina sp. 2201CG5-10]|uniref:hypothetical protein n=1 Tax=Aquimarina callyspongiae TaxID=3098150 RepID=UPI002AB42345|nr:hypothetical protein [Aquimarina sp. 2201CG5-10]MDY8135911.1 hypothetical protein [Aquimarina sp. 2201CG5-10]
MRKKGLLIIALLITNVLLAQHKIGFSKRIKDKTLNDQTGILLVKTSKNILYGIDPTQLEILWKQETLEKFDFSSYKEIPFTPLVFFDSKPLISSELLSNTIGTKGKSRTILNVANGNILFDSKTKGYKAVNNTLLIPEQEAIFVDGIKNKSLVIGFYNYKNGKTIWETNLNDANFLKTIKSSLFDQEKVVLDTEKDIFWLKKKYLLKINKETGAIVFRKEGVTSFEMSKDGSTIFIFSNHLKLKKLNNQTVIQALSTKTLEPIWDKESIVWGNVKQSIVDQKMLIVITSKGFNTINMFNGEKQWDKSSFLPLIKKIIPVEDGYLVAQEKFLNHISSQGQKTWENPVKISLSNNENPIHILEDTQSAIYITPSRANKITINNGQKSWEDVILNSNDFVTRNLKLREHPYRIWYDQKHQQFPVYSQGDFYIFSDRSTKAPISLYKFDFERASLPDLTIRDDGYFLNHSNKFYYFDTFGKLVYSKEYSSIQNTSIFNASVYWVKRGVRTYTSAIGFTANQLNQTFKNVIVSKDVGFLNQVASGVYGSYQSYQNVINKVTSINSLEFDSRLKTIFSRVKKSQQENDEILVVVPNDDDTIKIIRLYIDSGQEKMIKQLKSDRSDFIIDQIENIIYFFDNKDVIAEKF